MPSDETKKTKSAPKKAFFIIAICFALLVFASFLLSSPVPKNNIDAVTVNGQKVTITVADTEAERAKGLCCRDSLPANHGMLFIYKNPGDYGFWMKDTKMPLDMIWINSDKQIVHIEHSAQPKSYPKTFLSPTPAQYILETNAGWAKRNNVAVGDRITF